MPVESKPEHRWYVVHTMSGFEKRVLETLRQRVEASGLAASFSEIKAVVPRDADAGRRMAVGYILAKMALTPESWQLVVKTPKVTGFAGNDNMPAAITDLEAQMLLAGAAAENARPPDDLPSYDIGELVRVIDGPFKGFNGNVDRLDPMHAKIFITVLLFGRPTPIELQYSQVEKT